MELLDEILKFLDTATVIVTLASIAAAATPTPKDDGLVRQAYKVIDFLAINIGKAKQ